MAKQSDQIELISFDEAIQRTDQGKKHLMIGNGFSISLFPKIFTYDTLFEQSKASGLLSSNLARVFADMETTDFEVVMEALQNASLIIRRYRKGYPNLSKRMTKDSDQLKNVLAETIAKNHPERPHNIQEEQYKSCRIFLSHFDGSIYTLNYDLLLYWTLMQSEMLPNLKTDDGFRNVEQGEEPYVVWDVQNTDQQKIFYLHGALHIYDAGAELKKFTWSKTDIALVDQIKDSLAKRSYPLIVTEGTSNQKKDRIQHSSFLGRAYRSFSSIAGSLFIYGHSLAENDEHLLKLIDKGKTRQLFVGIYGDPNSANNLKIVKRARKIPDRRSAKYPVDVQFYNASSAHVWDRNPS